MEGWSGVTLHACIDLLFDIGTTNCFPLNKHAMGRGQTGGHRAVVVGHVCGKTIGEALLPLLVSLFIRETWTMADGLTTADGPTGVQRSKQKV